MRIITKKTIHEECWNLNYELIKWLNEHLKVFLEDNLKSDWGNNLDYEYHKETYRGKKYTQRELLEMLIDITDELLKDEDFGGPNATSDDIKKICKHQMALVNKMYDILKLVHWHLSW